MKLLVMRHGAAVDPGAVSDAQRHLTGAGRLAVRRVGERVAELGLSPTVIYTSPLVRAVQTAELLAAAASYPGEVWAHPPLVPGGTTAHALGVLDAHGDRDVVAFVSHEPTVRVLCGHLSGLGGSFPPFRTAGVAVLELSDGRAELVGRVDPHTLTWRGPDDLGG